MSEEEGKPEESARKILSKVIEEETARLEAEISALERLKKRLGEIKAEEEKEEGE